MTADKTIAILIFAALHALGSAFADEPPEGERLARQHCAGCHQFPEPELLPRKSWNFLLTYMGLRLGIDDFSYLDGAPPYVMGSIEARKELLGRSGLIPPAPAMGDADWKALRSYYAERAPEASLPQPEKPATVADSRLFAAKPTGFTARSPVTTLAKIDEANQQIIFGELLSESFTILDRKLRYLIDYPTKDSFWLRAIPTKDGIYMLSIGDFIGGRENERLGRIFYGKRVADMYVAKGMVLKGLYRPSDMAFGDLTGDGRDEVVVCNFGIETGDVSIYRLSDDGLTYDPTPFAILDQVSGGVECEVYDFDGDGRLDVAVLISNAQENFSIYLNRGEGAFERKTLIEEHPCFGYTAFQLVDFNQDGNMDIVIVNGDNGDSDPYNTLKPYHGVRIYLGDGKLGFAERYFYPMYGAYGARAADFDGDGDLDLAINAFHPDFDAERPDNFVLLEQTAPFAFAAKTHPAAYEGRWMTMDAGDLDGDGDTDVVLGGAYVNIGLGMKSPEELAAMLRRSRSTLYLENQTAK